VSDLLQEAGPLAAPLHIEPWLMGLDESLSLHHIAMLSDIISLHKAGGCYASRKHFSNRLRCSVRTVSEIIKTLTDNGFITVTETHYIPEDSAKIAAISAEFARGGCAKSARGSADFARGSAKSASPSKKEDRRKIEGSISGKPVVSASEHQAMFEFAAKLCRLDWNIKSVSGQIARSVKEWRDAGYSLANLERFAAHWNENFPGNTGKAPSLNNIAQGLGKCQDDRPTAQILSLEPDFNIFDSSAAAPAGWRKEFRTGQYCDPGSTEVKTREVFYRWVREA
jgi:hypothetical protein